MPGPRNTAVEKLVPDGKARVDYNMACAVTSICHEYEESEANPNSICDEYTQWTSYFNRLLAKTWCLRDH